MSDTTGDDPRGRHRGPRGRSPRVSAALPTLRLGGKVVAALVSAALLVGAGYFRHTYTSLDRGLHRVAVGGLGQPAPVAPGEPAPQHVDGAAQNLLVIGDDDRSGLTAAQRRTLHVGASSPSTSTDTLMVVHVPADGSKATLISIPRDTYVDIPGFDSNKINAAYADGHEDGTDGFPITGTSSDQDRQSAGLTLLIRVIKNLTGLQIDHYVLVNFLGFYSIAAAIGGVTVTLCRDVDDRGASGFVMSAGTHQLTPLQALEFVRQRHNLTDAQGRDLGDFGREARQRYFLAAAFARIESAGTLLSPGKLNSLVAAVQSTLTVDGGPSGLSLDGLAHQMLDLTGGNIVGQTIPTTGGRRFPAPVGDVVTVDPVQVRDQIQRWMTPATHTTAPSRPAAPTQGASSAPSAAAPSTPAAPAATAATATSGVAVAARGCVN